MEAIFQPTRPLRGATASRSAESVQGMGISTHAPLAGRDRALTVRTVIDLISTHAPLAGRDPRESAHKRCEDGFQPTRPLRGATKPDRHILTKNIFQPTRPLRGATMFARPR